MCWLLETRKGKSQAAAYWETVRLYRQRKKASGEVFFIPLTPSWAVE